MLLEKKDKLDKSINEYIKFLNLLSEEKVVTQAIEKNFFKATDKLLKNADMATKDLSRKENKELKNYFRSRLSKWVCSGVISKRGFEKPRGYPGDYFTLEMIYNKKDVSKNVVGKLFDRYLLEDSYVIAVRNRKTKMNTLTARLVTSSKDKDFRILNIASGAARDVRELLSNNKRIANKALEFVLLDQDSEALNFSKKELGLIRHKIRFKFLEENIANLFRNEELFRKKLGEYNLVYSIGLIDYISDFLLEELTKFSYDLLKKEGVLLYAVKNTKQFKSLSSDWFCDWNFYFRDQKELIKIIKKALKGQAFKLSAIKGLDKHISFVSIQRTK
jgi:extracellular factor (EF) 3-hydroxypalmitic acid methyl ester biosynthesis protein